MKAQHQLRLLHVRSQHGYTSRVSEGMPGEPEAVSADYQRQLTRRAQADERARDTDRIREATAAMSDALGTLDGVRGVESQVRAMRRQLAQLRHKLRGA